MKISVIIPTYNSERYLVKTLSTVAKQEYSPCEVIVVDGASTDRTEEIVRAFGHLITTFISESDEGQLDAVQKGIQRATGDVLYWLNADDAVMPGAFQTVANIFLENPAVEIVYGDNYWFHEESQKIGVTQSVKNLSFWDQFLFYGQLQVESFFCRREVAYKALPFNTNLRVYTDYSYFLPVRYGAKCKWVPLRLGAFRVHAEQMHRVNMEKGNMERELVKQQMRDRIGMSLKEFSALQQRHLIHYYFFQRFYSKLISGLRYSFRKMSGDYQRKRLARFFFDEWIVPPLLMQRNLDKVVMNKKDREFVKH